MFKLNRNVMDRRTFIRGMTTTGAVTLGLPLLEAMLNDTGEALAQGGALPTRFVTWFYGNGVDLNKWEPDNPGSASWNPSVLLQDIADVKDYITVCTGLDNMTADGLTHHQGSTMLSGYTPIRRSDLDRTFSSDHGGPTIDQLISAAIAKNVSLPIDSLQLAISKFGSPVDGGTTSEAISVKGEPGALLALPPVSSPARVWRYIFGDEPAPSELRTSMLDFLRRDLGRMRQRLGSFDRHRMDVHLDGIRSLERKFDILDQMQNNPDCTIPSAVTEDNGNLNGEEPLSLINGMMAELTALAFDCDVTRVASVLFLPIAGESTFGDVPASIGPSTAGKTHHNWSHDQGPGYDTNVRHIMNQFGDWLRTFQAHSEPGGGTLLDASIFYATTEIANGNHTTNRTPVMLGGHGRNYLKYPGIHYQAIAGSGGNLNVGAPCAGNASDVLLALMQAFDPTVTSVGGPSAASGLYDTSPTAPVSDILA